MTKREREGFRELMAFHCGGTRGIVEAGKSVSCFCCLRNSPGLFIDMSDGVYFPFTVCYKCLEDLITKGRSHAS